MSLYYITYFTDFFKKEKEKMVRRTKIRKEEKLFVWSLGSCKRTVIRCIRPHSNPVVYFRTCTWETCFHVAESVGNLFPFGLSCTSSFGQTSLNFLLLQYIGFYSPFSVLLPLFYLII